MSTVQVLLIKIELTQASLLVRVRREMRAVAKVDCWC